MLVLIAYIAVIFLANWAIQAFHLVPVGFGLMAPAGVYFAGLAFTLRDLVQDKLGRNWTIGAILAGALLSYLIEPKFALASGIAFLLSELLDFAVYTPLRKRNWMLAVTLSNLAGLVADSALFLMIAFGSIEFLAGQIVGKLWMTMGAVAVLWLIRRRHPSHSASASK
ncbi:MAG: VUT family protein [Alphaproteobacteria bacterium]|nr:VUT family protein [Alphaproteobacteria bacterium]